MAGNGSGVTTSAKGKLLLALVVGLEVAIVSALLYMFALPGNSTVVYAEELTSGPSIFCHVTDGAFTDCEPDGVNLPEGDTTDEWADITPATFTETGGVVYVDQADLINNFLIADWEAGDLSLEDFLASGSDGNLDHFR